MFQRSRFHKFRRFKKLGKFRNNFFFSVFRRFEFYRLLEQFNFFYPVFFVFLNSVGRSVAEVSSLGAPTFLKFRQILVLFPFLKRYSAGFRRLGILDSTWSLQNKEEGLSLNFFLDKAVFSFDFNVFTPMSSFFWICLHVFLKLFKFLFFLNFFKFFFLNCVFSGLCQLITNFPKNHVLIIRGN